MTSPVSVFQIFKVLSEEAETIRDLLGENAHEFTTSKCLPLEVSFWEVLVSHIFKVLSDDPEATRVPSGE